METVEVFLVEDNPADVLLVRVALSQVPFPLKLLVAKDGEQALKMLSSSDFQPHLIILDLNMPRVDGQTVLQQFQQKKIPIVIFSSTQNKAETERNVSIAKTSHCNFIPTNAPAPSKTGYSRQGSGQPSLLSERTQCSGRHECGAAYWHTLPCGWKDASRGR